MQTQLASPGVCLSSSEEMELNVLIYDYVNKTITLTKVKDLQNSCQCSLTRCLGRLGCLGQGIWTRGCFTNSDGPSDRWLTILLWTDNVGRWSIFQSDGPSLLVKLPSGEGADVRGGFYQFWHPSAVCASNQWDWGMGSPIGLWRASSWFPCCVHDFHMLPWQPWTL